MDRLQIEKKGGIAGFGGPQANIKSEGELNLSTLPPEQRQAVESLFEHADSLKAPPGAANYFTYHITRTTPSGPKTIEVPEFHVPDVVKESVTDRLK